MSIKWWARRTSTLFAVLHVECIMIGIRIYLLGRMYFLAKIKAAVARSVAATSDADAVIVVVVVLFTSKIPIRATNGRHNFIFSKESSQFLFLFSSVADLLFCDLICLFWILFFYWCVCHLLCYSSELFNWTSLHPPYTYWFGRVCAHPVTLLYLYLIWFESSRQRLPSQRLGSSSFIAF